MPDFILYLIKANVAILLFYAGYYLLLRHLTFYTLNRYYFLFALVCSTGYPLIKTDGLWAQHAPIPQEALIAIADWQQPPVNPAAEWLYIQALFLAVAGVLGIRFILRLASLRQIHLTSTPAVWKTYRYFHTAANISPFSFWKSIYLHPPRHQENELKDILEHEQVHVDQLHSIDILLAELCMLLFWFNPFVWLMRRSISENLEFITDREALRSGLDAKTYQYHLLKNLTSGQPQLGSSFTFKSLKNRIIMMNKKKSSSFQLGKYMVLIPAVLLLITVVTVSRAKQEIKTDKAAVKEKKAVDNISPGKSPESVVALSETDTQKTKAIEPTIKASGTLPQGRTRQLNEIKVRIDKTTSGNPLYVIDGIPQKYGEPNDINPEEIEAISVLKDKSATALYGDKGKNGVIIITTKKGKGLNATKQESVLPDNSNLTSLNTSSFGSDDPLVLLDGKEIDGAIIKRIDPNTIASMDITTPKNGIQERGIIRISTKKN